MVHFGDATTGAEVVEAFKDSLKSKSILITGPSDGGIGAETAVALAGGSPSHIILAGRTLSKIQPVSDRIKTTNRMIRTDFVPLDLSCQASIRKAASIINKIADKLDIVINNAAIMACPFAKTADGIESQFGTNYVGHFLLTNLIMPKILDAGPHSRIVNVSSSAHRMSDVRLHDWNFEDGATYHPFRAYGSAKTAIILFTSALTDQLKDTGVVAVSLHPGSIRTNLQAHMNSELRREAVELIETNTGRLFPVQKTKSLEQGCSTTLVAALDPAVKSGSYLEDCNLAEPEAYAREEDRARQLWTLSEDLVGQRFDW